MSTLKYFIFLVALSMGLLDICSGNASNIAMLNQMRIWGKNFKNMLIDMDHIAQNTMQYLVVAIVPSNVNHHPIHMDLLSECSTALPNTLNHDKHIVCGTSAVLLNKVDEAIWQRSRWHNEQQYRDHLWHGEYMLLEDGILNRLVNHFRNQYPNAQCEVFLYSYYIPCNYNSNKQPYKCSMLISDYKRVNAGPCQITAVGYSSVFSATVPNLDEIINDLNGQDVSVLKVTDPASNTDSAINTRNALHQVSNAITATVQAIMNTCLRSSPLATCLHGPNGHVHTNQLIAYFVNDLMYNVLHSFRKTYHGSLSESIHWRKTCATRIDAELEKMLGNGNQRCPDKNYNKILISTCAWKGLDFANYFGKPVGNVVDGLWERYEGEWKLAYNTTYQSSWSTNIHCLDHHLTKGSLCTSTFNDMVFARGEMY